VEAVIRDVAPPATLTDILTALLDGPTRAESTAGLQSFLTGPTDVHATEDAGIATVDFSINPFQIVGPDQTLAVAQVVYTATSQPGVTGVLFQIDGRPIEVPTAAGVQVPGPVTDATYAPQAPVTPGT
jgi:spore germination protein GerM